MRAARIETGLVADLWEVPSLEAFDGITLIAAPDKVAIGWAFDGTTFSPPVLALADAKTATLTRLAGLAEAKLEGGTVVNGSKVRTDAKARSLFALGKMDSRALRKIVTNGDQEALLTAAEFDGMVAAVNNFGQAVMDRWYDLIKTIKAATTLAELQAIDITTGWPA